MKPAQSRRNSTPKQANPSSLKIECDEIGQNPIKDISHEQRAHATIFPSCTFLDRVALRRDRQWCCSPPYASFALVISDCHLRDGDWCGRLRDDRSIYSTAVIALTRNGWVASRAPSHRRGGLCRRPSRGRCVYFEGCWGQDNAAKGRGDGNLWRSVFFGEFSTPSWPSRHIHVVRQAARQTLQSRKSTP
jgi:hypothetical protein